MKKQKAVVLEKECVACGCCQKVCPKSAIKVKNGITAVVSNTLCIGCGLCQKACPASVISMEVYE